MIERPSRRDVTRPHEAKTFRLLEDVFCSAPVWRAISPAARPSGPASTSSRNACSRPSCPRAASDLAALLDSMYRDISAQLGANPRSTARLQMRVNLKLSFCQVSQLPSRHVVG